MKSAQMKVLVATLEGLKVGDEVSLDIPEMLAGLGGDSKVTLIDKKPNVGKTSTYQMDVTMLGVHLYYVTIVAETKGLAVNYTLEIE